MNIFVFIALFSGLLFILIFWAWFVLWKDLFVDEYRQQLFEVRDELFNMAFRGELPFDSEGYLSLRELLNGTIRFAHVMSPFTLIILHVYREKILPDTEDEYADPRIKSDLENYPETFDYVFSKSASLTIDHLSRSSLLTKVLFFALRSTRWSKNQAAKKMEPWMNEVSVAGTSNKFATYPGQLQRAA